MASKRDYYEVLGVPQDADPAVIKSAYRKLAVRYHPDRNPGDSEAEDNFKESAEAYAVLSVPEKRARYDRFGHQAEQPGFGGFDPSIFGDFSDILGDFFGLGGRRRTSRGTPGADLRYDLSLTFEEAAFGHEVEIRIPRLETCERCSGSGSKSGQLTSCSTCGGQGRVRYTQGFFSVARPCPDCGGEGRMVTDPCFSCRGQGRIEQDRNLKVTIPPGVDGGIRLRLRGEGEHGRRGGPTGDLDVLIRVEPHERFERDGVDVHEKIELTYSQLVLGTSIKVASLYGEQSLKIPAGTSPGHEFSMRGKGIQELNSHRRGNHIVHITLRVPRPSELDEEHLDLLRKLAALEGAELYEGSVLSKVKNLFV